MYIDVVTCERHVTGSHEWVGVPERSEVMAVVASECVRRIPSSLGLAGLCSVVWEGNVIGQAEI